MCVSFLNPGRPHLPPAWELPCKRGGRSSNLHGFSPVKSPTKSQKKHNHHESKNICHHRHVSHLEEVGSRRRSQLGFDPVYSCAKSLESIQSHVQRVHQGLFENVGEANSEQLQSQDAKRCKKQLVAVQSFFLGALVSSVPMHGPLHTVEAGGPTATM